MTRTVAAHDIAKHEESGAPSQEAHGNKPSIDRVVNLLPGFVYVFSHVTYSNDYTNRSVAEHLGHTSEEIRAFGPQMMAKLVLKEDLPLLAAHMMRIAQLSDNESVALEYRVTTKGGEVRWLRSVDAVFERDAAGTVLRHIGCASDITTQKRAELRLAELNAELEQKVAERTRDLARLNTDLETRITERTLELQQTVDELERLTYVATHDLKVPVNNLSRLGLMLAEKAHLLLPEQVEQVSWINKCTDQLNAKIKGLVLVAQIRMGDFGPSERFNLRGAVARAVEVNGLSGPARGVQMRIDIAPEITIRFPCLEFDSILETLLDNAVKYACADRPLQIRIKAVLRDGAVQLRVRDNGSGFDPLRDGDKVFGLFQRAHKSPAGSGISLYCAREMLTRQGGDLLVRAKPGAGAEFTVKFPMDKGTP